MTLESTITTKRDIQFTEVHGSQLIECKYYTSIVSCVMNSLLKQSRATVEVTNI